MNAAMRALREASMIEISIEAKTEKTIDILTFIIKESVRARAATGRTALVNFSDPISTFTATI